MWDQARADKPDSWSWRTGEGGQGEFEWAGKIVHSGQKSLRIKRTGAAGYTSLVSEFVPVAAGKTYRVSAWIYPVKPVRRGVYFMITQHKRGTQADDLPNTFGVTTAVFVQQTWQEVAVKLTVREGVDRIRIHCLQAYLPSDLYWDDFTVAENAEEPKPRYEPSTPEVVPPLTPELRATIAKRSRARATVEIRGERPRLIVDGRPTPFAWYVSAFGGPDFLRNTQIGDFMRAGVRVYLVPLVLGNGLYGVKGPWLSKDRYDFSVIDDLLWRVLRVDPKGYVVFYMCCDPYPAWGVENPDDVTQDQNGQKAIVAMHPKRWGNDPGLGERFAPSIVSLKLREDVAATLRRLVAHVESTEPGKAVIGYHVAGFNDGQWFQWASFDPANLHLADYCPGAQEAFRAWLKTRSSHGESAKDVGVPSFERLWGDKVFIDSKTEQDVADYQRFYSEGVTESILSLVGLLKKESKRPIVCGTYYEDITCNSANHIALGRFLNSTALDYMAGPAAYSIRMAGCQGAVRNVFGSTTLHGKMYLTEQDWRSWHSGPDPDPQNNFAWGRAETADIHNAMVRRECGMMLAFGLGTWWYDMSGGWFRDDQIMAGVAEAVRAFDLELADKKQPQADLAVFVSEESDSYIRMRYGGEYRYRGIVSQIEELNTAGVPYRLYLQSDLGKVKLPDHRAYLFLNPYVTTPDQRRAIEALKRDAKLLAFMHAPGIIGSADPAKTASEITGLKLARFNRGKVSSKAAGTTPNGMLALLAGIEDEVIMSPTPPANALAVVDLQATPLTTYENSKAVGAAARDFGAWKSVFLGSPGTSAGFVNHMAKWAGCWVTSPPGDAVYASQHFLTIHAIFPGHKFLRLKAPAKVTDLTSGEIVSERAQQIELDMQRGQTRWFRLD
ncbi:MAG: carbohydrate binding domain-containing protein [Thermoguttaceae bacterium]